MVNHPNRKKKTGLLKFNVLNRFSGEVQFTAEIDSTEDAATSFKLGLAAKWAIESRADLSRADLSGANLSGADLSGADLSGAYRPSDPPAGYKANAHGRLEKETK